MLYVLTGKMINNGCLYHDNVITTDGERIADIFPYEDGKIDGKNIIDLRGLTVVPGFIDLHMHGAMGYDVMDASYEALEAMSVFKVNEGCTSFCPTTITAPMEKIEKAVMNIRSAIDRGTSGAKILGAYLEGPWINPEWKGAHPEEHIRTPDMTEINRIINTGNGCVKSIIIAPDTEGAVDVIKAVTDMGVQVRLGHTGASYDEAKLAVEAGANLATHTYNQMSLLHHREPGMVGAVMTIDELSGELICDFIHTHKAAAEILVKAKGKNGIVLVTDSIAATGLSDGKYKLGELDVNVINGVSRLPNGTLAGSTTSLIECVRNLHLHIKIPLEDVIEMVTANPAKSIGMFHEIGSLDKGKYADMVAIDDDLIIKKVIIGGVVRK